MQAIVVKSLATNVARGMCYAIYMEVHVVVAEADATRRTPSTNRLTRWQSQHAVVIAVGMLQADSVRPTRV